MENILMKERKVISSVRGIEIVCCLIAFFMARVGIEGGYYTLGIAYIGALFYSKNVRRWAWLFACCGILSLAEFNVSALKYVMMLTLMTGCRFYLDQANKKFTGYNQMLIVGMSLFLGNLIAYMIEGFNVYRGILTVLEAVAGVGICYVLQFSINVFQIKRLTPLTKKEAISMMFLFACIIGGVVDLYIKLPVFQEIYFKDILIIMLMMAVTYLGGINLGVTFSVVVGSILVIIGYITPEQIGIYALAALIGGLFQPVGRLGVVLGICVGQVLGFIVFNDKVIDLPLLGALILGSTLTCIVPKNYFGMGHWFGEDQVEETEKQHLSRVQGLMTDRLKAIVKGFKKLERSMKDVEHNYVDYTPKLLNRVIEETAEEMCQACSMKHFCWEQDLKHTYDYAYKMIGTIERKGRLQNGDIPDGFKAHCIQDQNFAYVLSYKLDLLKQDMMWQNKFIENRALVAEELGAVAHTLEQLIHEIDQEMYFNKEEENAIKEIFRAEGIKYNDVLVIEKRGRTSRIIVYTPKHSEALGKQLVNGIHKACGYMASLEKCQYTEDGYQHQLSICNMYRVSAGSALSAKSDISGDVHTFMPLEDSQYLLGLADGMGSGMLAYEESSAAMEMLEDFMDSGFQQELAVRMINAALILKSKEEVFSTMDITLIDRRTGIAEFLKAGASTSFILRNGEVMTVKASSLPVGILKEIKVKIKKVQLEPGDIVIMVTDGILESKDDVLGKEETFKHFITEVDGRDPQYMADYLMRKSKDLLGVEECDDMTIVVARVWQEPLV